MEALRVTSPDGLSIAAQVWGNPSGREILFIHGFNQCHLSWRRQFSDPQMAAEFRIVTYDLRGHGSSDKPDDAASYANDRFWADDAAAVIAAAGMKRPILVGWSFGGRTISDYINAFGTGGLGGIGYVGATTKTIDEYVGPGRNTGPGMVSDDLAANIASTRNFLRACFERQPSPDDFETMLAFNMVIPARVRAAIRTRGPNDGASLKKIGCPVLVIHGEKDQLIRPAMAQYTAENVPGARLSIYQGIGHAPFWEDAPRFNRELAEFARAT